MHWIHFTHEDQLQNIIVRSQEKPQVIFKYNTQCHLSEVILKRLQSNCCPEHMDFHFLDLGIYSTISEKVSEKFKVPQQSSQILLINEGKCIFEESHSEISLEEIMEHVTAAA